MPTITLPAGQVNIKGPQSATGVDRWISQECSLALTGLVLTVAIAISVPAGALTLTGQTNVNPLAQPESRLQYTGLAPSLGFSTSDQVISPGVGALTWQGLAPAVRIGDLGVDIPAGQLVFKGPARPQVVSQFPATVLAYTGTVTGVLVDTPGATVSIPAGVLRLTGQTPDRLNDFSLAIPAGTLTLTGRYVAVQFIQPAAGALTWQGLTPSIPAQTLVVAIPRGQLVVGNTLIPSLRYDFVQPLPAGQLTLAGLRPNVGTPDTLVMQVGVLALTGTTPTIDWTTALPVGRLLYTGTTTQVDVATGAPPIPVGSLVWTGYAPDLLYASSHVLSARVRILRAVSAGVAVTRTLESEVER